MWNLQKILIEITWVDILLFKALIFFILKWHAVTVSLDVFVNMFSWNYNNICVYMLSLLNSICIGMVWAYAPENNSVINKKWTQYKNCNIGPEVFSKFPSKYYKQNKAEQTSNENQRKHLYSEQMHSKC